MKKNISMLVCMLLLSASCSLFGKQGAGGGVAKTVNGGADWQLSNAIRGGKSSLSGLNVSHMAFDPQNREIIFAGGYNDGLYKSVDSGQTWQRILSNILVYDFQVHPQDGKTIYVAGLFNGHGRVLLTKDGGASWNQVFNDASENNAVRSIVLNPANPSQMLIGLENGNVIKSTDAGYSWKFIKDAGDRVSRMLWQNNAGYVLLHTGGLYKTDNFGDSFTKLTGSLATSTPSTYSSSIVYNQFYVDAVSPQLIYVTSNQGLFKTLDEGKTWSKIPIPIKQADSQPYGIAVARNSSNIVYASIGSTIYKSTDGGYDWQTQKVATNGTIDYILIDPQLPQIVYAGIYGQ